MIEKILLQMLRNKIIEKEDYEIYQYGIKNGIIILLNFLTTILIGLMTTKLLQVLLFNLVFMTIRSYAGGLHAEDKVICYLFSSMVQFIPILSEDGFEGWNVKIITAVLLISFSVIFSFCPMDSINRKLDENEKKVYEKKAKVHTLIWVVVFSILYLKKDMTLSNAVFDGIVMVALSMLIGKAVLSLKYLS